VLVTGAAGFLGSHVADAFVAAGHDVLAYDMATVSGHASVRGDLLDAATLVAAAHGRDVICHLAAIGDVYLAGRDPALAATANVVGTARVCDAAQAAGAKVVLASTWEVYGRGRADPVDEDHPCEPDHPYNITKLAAERLGLSYFHLRGLPVIALRLGTAYGTRMRQNSVFSRFIDRALRGEPIQIHGSGDQTRQFTHTSDIAGAFTQAAHSENAGRVYNVVADEVISIRDLAERVARTIPAEVTFGPARPGDVPSLRVTSERAQRELGWRARMAFDLGLERIIEERRTQLTPVL